MMTMRALVWWWLAGFSAVGTNVSVAAEPSKVPEFVAAMAHKVFPSANEEVKQLGEEKFVIYYTLGFFEGFTSPTGSLWSEKPNAFGYGHSDGRAYNRAHLKEAGKVFAAFGFVEVECDGDWRSGFEISAFEPDKTELGKNWWLSDFGATWPAIDPPVGSAGSTPVRGPTRPVRLHVQGYLSPKGYWGHLGVYERELFATVVEKRG